MAKKKSDEARQAAQNDQDPKPMFLGEQTGSGLPFDGVRVIDVATFIAAPYAATIMAEFGAEVLKVEHPLAGDPLRRFGTMSEREDSTMTWLSEARNKKSVTIDLRHVEGADLFKKLVAKADVVCENFRPGTLEKWGLGWEVLSEINPKLIMLRVSGFGQTGPYRDRPGFAHIAHAVGGLSYLAGFPGQTPVTPGSTPLGDYMSGMYGAIGVLLALFHRDKTGEGQVIDVGLYEAVFRQLDELAAAYGMYGKIREREGSGTVIACPHGHFHTKDDKWVALACTTDKIFARLCEGAMDKPELASSHLYGEQRKRLAGRKEVDAIVTEWCESLDREEIIAKCVEAEVPCGALNNIGDIFKDPHFEAREMISKVADPAVGWVSVPSVYPRLSATPGRIETLGPSLGQHTFEMLTKLLNLSQADLTRLRNEKVI